MRTAISAGVAGLRRWFRRPARTWVRRAALAAVLLVMAPMVVGAVALRSSYAGDPGDGTRSRGRDAIWLGHAWVDGRKGDRDLDAFAARVRETGIRDLYVHAGPLEHDGTLPVTRYPRARWLVDGVHRRLPGVRVQAWLGDKLATEGPRGLRLERPATRAAMVDSSRQVLADGGFDGVHFDLEPMPSGNRPFLELLDAVRPMTRAHNARLSVAAHQIDPVPKLHSAARKIAGHPKWWSQAYFGQVAKRVDQIAVMSYDTSMPLESLYGGYVAQQSSLALEVTPKDTDLLMGLPFFQTETMGHHASAETVKAAVRGVRLGLGRTDRHREHFGVALYVDFTARAQDWAAYDKGWN